MKGSIQAKETKTKGTVYRVFYNLPTDQEGNRRRLTKTHEAREEAENHLLRLNYREANGEVIADSDMKVHWFFQELFLPSHKREIKETTYHTYEGHVHNHIIPEIGQLSLKDVDSWRLEKFLEDKENELSAWTVSGIHTVLSAAFRKAHQRGLLRNNPMEHVSKPETSKQKYSILEKSQVNQLLKAAKEADEPMYPLIHTAVTSGLRIGELLGLRWVDLDLKKGTATIRKQLPHPYRCKELHLQDLKTDSSRRQIVLSPKNVNVLKARRSRYLKDKLRATDWKNRGVVFSRSDGGFIRSRSSLRQKFKRVLKSAGLPDIRFHDLRHTAATLALQEGINPKIVQERLGHGSIETTMDVYSHVTKSMQQDAAEQLDRAYEFS